MHQYSSMEPSTTNSRKSHDHQTQHKNPNDHQPLITISSPWFAVMVGGNGTEGAVPVPLQHRETVPITPQHFRCDKNRNSGAEAGVLIPFRPLSWRSGEPCSREPTPHQEMIIKNSHKPSTNNCVTGENAGDHDQYVQDRKGPPENESGGDGCGGAAVREKLMRHRKEVSGGGRIVIPERWGHEDLLKDWIDYSTFDALLAPKEGHLARQALVGEARQGRCVPKLNI